MQYFISIIIPVYRVNYEQLKRCIESAINQRIIRYEYEIILIDDGSPDRCGEICELYASENKNVSVIHQENQGLSVVRNVGVKEAKGEWVCFVDGDDWIGETFIQEALEFCETAPEDSDLLIWDGYAEFPDIAKPIGFFDSNDKEILEFRGKDKEKVIDRILPLHVTKKDITRCTDIGVTWGRIYRKNMLEKNNVSNIPGLKVMQDSVFNLYAIEYSRVVCYKYVLTYHYSMYDESISKQYSPGIIDTMDQLYSYFEEYILEFHNEDEYWKRLYIRTIRMIAKCVSKEYANPKNNQKFNIRVEKMKKDIEKSKCGVAIEKCPMWNQELKFVILLFFLKVKNYKMIVFSQYVLEAIRKNRLERKSRFVI